MVSLGRLFKGQLVARAGMPCARSCGPGRHPTWLNTFKEGVSTAFESFSVFLLGPHPVGHLSFGAAQGMVGFLACKHTLHTLVAHVSSTSTLKSSTGLLSIHSSPKSIQMFGIAPTRIGAFGRIELHEVLICLSSLSKSLWMTSFPSRVSATLSAWYYPQTC